MDLLEILLIIGASIVILVIVLILFKILKKKKTAKITNEDTKTIISLFGLNNIIKVEQTQKRVRVEVKDLGNVDLEGLNVFTNGVFTSGNKVVVTFKENTEQIVEALEELK